MIDWATIEQLLYVVGLVYLVPLFHEFGHAWYLKEKLKKDVKIELKRGFPKAVVWYKDEKLTPQQERDIYYAGILGGFIPFLVVSGGIHILFFVPMFLAYIFSCRKDIIKIWRVKNEKENDTLQR